jgi:hypothetical protein
MLWKKEDVLIKEPCNCLPLCNAEWFEPEISYATFPGRAFFSSNHSTSVLKRIATKLNLDSDTDLDQYLKYLLLLFALTGYSIDS